MDAEQIFASAFSSHAAGDLPRAEELYRLILSERPVHVMAKHYLGVLLHQRGQSAAGLELIRSALETDAGSASRYNDLGNLLVQTADLDNAAGAFRASLALTANDANVWNNLGSVLHRQNRLDEAEFAYRKALEFGPTFVPALNNLSSLLARSGRDEESSRLLCLAYIQPPLQHKSLKELGVAYFRLGLTAEAAECYREWLRLEPDNAYAKLHLAACTGENVPEKMPGDYVKNVFDEMSGYFEEKLVATLGYSGPEIIANLLAEHFSKDRRFDVLDGGCGTGLLANLLSAYARSLVGVDISAGMLEKARAKQVYDELLETELSAFLQGRGQTFDLIVMADTLIYFGDLHEIFAAVRHALRPAGSFAFTLELNGETGKQQIDYYLSPSGRFSHSTGYLAKALDSHGFKVLESQDVVIRYEFGLPIPGLGLLAYLEPINE
ncbi:MAG: tetratricopeptide repeat protein [Methylomonas sp.]|jgi:predicted TPR repeat methyltransferase